MENIEDGVRFKGHDDGKQREKWKKEEKSWLTGPIGEDDVGGVSGICAIIGPSVQGLSARDRPHTCSQPHLLFSQYVIFFFLGCTTHPPGQYVLRVPCVPSVHYILSSILTD